LGGKGRQPKKANSDRKTRGTVKREKTTLDLGVSPCHGTASRGKSRGKMRDKQGKKKPIRTPGRLNDRRGGERKRTKKKKRATQQILFGEKKRRPGVTGEEGLKKDTHNGERKSGEGSSGSQSQRRNGSTVSTLEERRNKPNGKKAGQDRRGVHVENFWVGSSGGGRRSQKFLLCVKNKGGGGNVGGFVTSGGGNGWFPIEYRESVKKR